MELIEVPYIALDGRERILKYGAETKRIFISNQDIASIDLSVLPKFKSLQKLEFQLCDYISQLDLSSLMDCPKFEELVLSKIKGLTSFDFQFLSQCQSFRSLRIDN